MKGEVKLPMTGSGPESLMPALCAELASLLWFILKLKLRGEKRHGTHHRGGIFQMFEIG